MEKIKQLTRHLAQHIIGQTHVIAEVVDVLEQAHFKMAEAEEPLAIFLFLGPTGVGKTEITKCFSHYLFGPDAYERFDMSEFSNPDSDLNFIGDHTGYVGRLGQVLAHSNKRVLLFDEVEKAHERVWKKFLQMLDAARITVGQGITHQLNQYIFVLTTNIGAQKVMRAEFSDFTTIEEAVIAELSRSFSPELVNRIDHKIVFKKLSDDNLRQICKLHLSHLLDRWQEFIAAVDLETINFLTDKGYSEQYGARRMKKTIQHHVRRAVAKHRIYSSGLPECLTVSPCRQFLALVPII